MERLLTFTSQSQQRNIKKTTKENIMASKNLDKSVQTKARKILNLRGNLKKAAEATGVDRTTVARVVNTGIGDENTIAVITEYFKSIKAA